MDLHNVMSVVGEGSSNGSEPSRFNLWAAIWSLKVANKVKIFLWRACHNFIPCGYNLRRRRIGSDAMCRSCGCSEESTLHALWYCKAARQVWKNTFLFGVYKEWREPSFQSLFSHVAAVFDKSELNLFVVVVWWIWKNRNDIKFGKVGLSGEQIVIKAADWIHDFANAHGPVTSATSSIGSSQQQSHWSVPSLHFIKLNVDAATDKQNHRMGLGAVIRNGNGSLICAAMEPKIGLSSVYVAEAYAILAGLLQCKQEGFRQVEVESDALIVIKTIEGGNWEFSPVGPIFDEIKLIANQLEEVRWKKIPRHCNGVAHALAKAAIDPNYMTCVLEGSWTSLATAIDNK